MPDVPRSPYLYAIIRVVPHVERGETLNAGVVLLHHTWRDPDEHARRPFERLRDHVLLQSIARVNRPYVDANGVQKRVGLVVDFVGVLRELRKALQFDSNDVGGVIEDLDVLLQDFLQRIAQAKQEYLDANMDGAPDERLEKLVFGRFLAPDSPLSAFPVSSVITADRTPSWVTAMASRTQYVTHPSAT